MSQNMELYASIYIKNIENLYCVHNVLFGGLSLALANEAVPKGTM